MRKEIQEYNVDYKIDWNTITNDPSLPDATRFKSLYQSVTLQQMQTCSCKHCFDTGITTFLYINNFKETCQAYALCTCEAIKNVVH
jgi:hypothetical protein